MTLRVLSVAGTRPEAIKMAPIIKELAAHPAHVDARVCGTGQHREMLAQMLGAFGVPIDYDLDVMQPGQQLSQLTARVLERLDPVLTEFQPHWVLVQGDTTTVFAASVAAFHRQIRVGHVEAGLRTGDRRQPFPEEMNRRLADTLADLHFAPTAQSRRNLLAEGVQDATIDVTGNTGIDALLSVASRPERPDEAPPLPANLGGRRVLLMTAHRRENFGAPIRAICQAIRDLVTTRDDLHVIYPVHPNPNITEPVHAILGNLPGVSLIAPQSYFPFVRLMQRATIVLTDSGGLQEEAPSLGKPVLVMRETTERPEAVEMGTVELVGTDTARIRAAVERLLDDPRSYDRMAHAVNPYGDGLASKRIVRRLLSEEGIQIPADDVRPFLPAGAPPG